MDDAIEQAVRRAITTMREKLGEQLTVDDMARAAMFSKFHFTRIFQRVTGVSPGRFLSALRLARAKQLLVSTSLNVADISLRVGYNSVGTFSSRFSRSVGMSPITYRRLAGHARAIPVRPTGPLGQEHRAEVSGEVTMHDGGTPGMVFLGLFADRIPEGLPACCAILPGPGAYRLGTVPPGTWWLLAQSVPDGVDPTRGDLTDGDARVSVATHGPLTIGDDDTLRVDLALKPARVLDPPVLLALLDARTAALARQHEHHPTQLDTDFADGFDGGVVRHADDRLVSAVGTARAA